MTLRKLGWIVGGFGLFSFACAVVFLYLMLFTDVLDATEEMTMYDCTACLRKDPAKCKTISKNWDTPSLNTEEDVRKRAASWLCHEVVPDQEQHEKLTCVDWVFDRRDEIFDIRCTSHYERRKKPWVIVPVH